MSLLRPHFSRCVLGCMALCLALTMLYAVPAFGAAPAVGATPIRVVYGFDREFPPFSFEDPGGEPVGFEVDLVRAIFNQPGVVLSTRPLQWENVMLELSSGAINITSSMVRTEQREKMFLFANKPNFLLQMRLFTKIYQRFPSAALLRGQRVSVEKSSYQHRLLEKFGGMNIKPMEGKLAGIRALYNDEVAAYFGPVPNTYFLINKMNYGAITTVGTPLGITELRFAVNRGRGDIQRLLNQGMQRIIDSGEYDRIYRKWFVRDLENNEIIMMTDQAKKAAIPAYAPYEASPQGATVLTATGKMFSACTVENAKPELTLSALSVALGKAIADGEFELRAALVVSPDGKLQEMTQEDRQRLFEFGRGILTVDMGEDGTPVAHMVVQKLIKPVTRPTPPLLSE
ncbi:transporter substrate-binding domain-containing protein [Desulfovibrio cuneatus]|uniref:transporter substrate-binding domain-containing protein n=1 Tax=Desulfovibrio cuneatus TaxID=159728 RepID=UPI00041FABAA|nr:transporter substrate-binding domain-containing protein [Desulfovibrio cuneatus]